MPRRRRRRSRIPARRRSDADARRRRPGGDPLDVLIDNLPDILRGFGTTLRLLVVSGLVALIGGVLLAAARVSPTPVLRALGTSYVNVIRNIPLVVLFLITTQGIPELGINASFFTLAVAALAAYTAAFVCEAVRSGINAVDVGQAEAARSIGMTFAQTLRLIVLPQAIRSVIPPLASILIALTKNTAIAEAFGVTEATYQLDSLVRDFPSALYALFFGIAFGYVLIVFAIAGVAQILERRLVVLR
ncbi:MAG TPA: amino acid ABC transporter permease [Gaiellaceae bacterium]